MSQITLEATYAPELVEYWAQKYKEAKEALGAQAAHKCSTIDHTSSTIQSELRELITSLQEESAKRESLETELRKMLDKALEDETTMRKKFLEMSNEKQNLVMHLSRANIENVSLKQQMNKVYSQTAVLATEADMSRQAKLKSMFEPVSFVELSFVPKALLFANPQKFLDGLPSQLTKDTPLYFLPRPPVCMPLRVPSCGQPGYWFHPAWTIAENTKFELIVEGRPGEWSYLGCYICAQLPGEEMRLSEWMTLDEQTKVTHCSRMANAGLERDQTAPYTTQLNTRRRYDLGELSVPCHSLRCVGFNSPLYHALLSAATPPPQNGKSSESSLVKRPRIKDEEAQFVPYNPFVMSKTDVGELPMKKKNRPFLERAPQELSRRMSLESIKSNQSDKENIIVE